MNDQPAPAPEQRHATLQLSAQGTVEFSADQLWPMHGDYARFGIDLESFAHEVTRRLRADGYVGYRPGEDRISIISIGAIERIDFAERAAGAASGGPGPERSAV